MIAGQLPPLLSWDKGIVCKMGLEAGGVGGSFGLAWIRLEAKGWGPRPGRMEVPIFQGTVMATCWCLWCVFLHLLL